MVLVFAKLFTLNLRRQFYYIIQLVLINLTIDDTVSTVDDRIFLFKLTSIRFS